MYIKPLMIRTPIIILLLLCAVGGVAQMAPPKATQGLQLNFKLLTNNYEGKSQSRSQLQFTVASNRELLAHGWKIYFNFARHILPASVSGGLQITHVNGDLYYISPGAGFQGIPSGRTLNMEFTSTDWLLNVSDAPSGFYLVDDNSPANFYAINGVTMEPVTRPGQYLRSPVDKISLVTPESIFEQNKIVRNIPADSLCKILPTPVSYQENAGSFVLDATVNIVAESAFNAESNYLYQTLKAMVLNYTGKQLIKGNSVSARAIILQHKDLPAEAYELEVSSRAVTISASSGAGAFYGIQSLKTLMAPHVYQRKQKSIALKNVVVKDEPRFDYRALMLDVARNFQPKRELLRLLDVMSLYKMNTLHLHCTDDEGWRIEIPELPELTQVGARRGQVVGAQDKLQPALGSGAQADSPPGSGFYSKPDFIEILKYANQRHISIIPEIESPGHARAAIKAMDARYAYYKRAGLNDKAGEFMLHDTADTSTYSSVQYWNDNVMDVSMPSVYHFIATVTQSLVNTYKEAGAPLQTIHFGGDEVPAGAWQGSPSFRRLMQADTTIHSADDLWLHYYSRVDSMLKKHNLYLTAWEEAGLVKKTENGKKVNVLNKGLLDKDVHLEVWNNVLGWGAEDLAYKQANAGYKVILSCVSNLYLDMAAEKAFEEPGYYWGGYVDVDKLFKFIPFNYFKNTTEDKMGNPLNKAYLATKEQLTEAGKANIVGLQGALWGETLKTAGQFEYMLLPKLLALAERAWSADPDWANTTDSTLAGRRYNDAWSRFVNVLGKRELPRLDGFSGGFNYRIPVPGAQIVNDTLFINSIYPGFKVYYTTDGSQPTAKSTLYTRPITYPGKLKMALINNAGRRGRIMEVGQ